MSARIVAEIDALLARLTAARDLLASTVTETAMPSAPMVIPEIAEVRESIPAAPAPVQVTVLKPRGPRARRTVPRRRASVSAVGAALSGIIPERPVAVSPKELATARGSRASEQPQSAPATPRRSALDELVMEATRRSA